RIHAFTIYTFGTGGVASFDAAPGLTIRFEAPSTRGTTALLLRPEAAPGTCPGELAPLAPPFALDFPLEGYARPLQCSFDPAHGAGLFRWEGRAGWRCAGVPGRNGSMVDVPMSGTYAVLADSKAPVLKRVGFTRRGPESGFFKSRLMFVSVHEEGTGVDPDATAAYLNGTRVVCEYDQYRSRVTIPVPRSFPAGAARLRVEIADLAGNRSVGEFNCVIN
ncbi:MAG TPA: hypothetical protein VMT60_00515, partial [Candidatus Bathyarchaeia archaeon]|nr:hypothetical protein [Candidatus Bathyarchaeia archaeon]